ncbi:MAG: peptidylprolyl isomerase [Prevotellaceae bacterium]|jgi:peptidyl-prolyl cis-trans isomerase SurA|nr:peptidylprolyl isomerase [Prevotellaceae bacterium]
MIKKILIFCSIISLALGNNLKAQQAMDKVVTVVGNEPILQSDVELFYKELQITGQLPEGNSRCKLLKMIIDQKILVAQAKLDSLEVGADLEKIPAMVERQLTAQVAQYGKETLEMSYRKSIDKIKEEMIEFQTERAYAQVMQAKIVGKMHVTPNEVEKFFKTISKDSLPTIPDQYMIYQIVKKPDSDAAIIAVKEQLLDLRKRILKGDKFQTLAILYSEDPESARRGGEVGLSPIEGYVSPVRNALNNMRPGQVSQIIESEYGYHILQLIEKQTETGLVNYRHILIKPKYSAEDRTLGFARLDSITRLVKADSISFEYAAAFFSDDEKSRMGKGLLVNNMFNPEDITPFFYKDQLNPNDFKAIEHLGVNEMSEPFESSDLGGNVIYKVVMLKSFVPAHKANIKDDYTQIKRVYEAKKRQDLLQQWVDKKIKTEYIRVAKDYETCDFVNATWLY